jgi:hypothetical protein
MFLPLVEIAGRCDAFSGCRMVRPEPAYWGTLNLETPHMSRTSQTWACLGQKSPSSPIRHPDFCLPRGLWGCRRVAPQPCGRGYLETIYGQICGPSAWEFPGELGKLPSGVLGMLDRAVPASLS